MTVINMPNRTNMSNPKPNDQAIANALSSLDDHVRLLRCVADSAALSDPDEADLKARLGELTESLYFLHGKLRAETDQLFKLL